MSLKQKYLLNNGPYQINFELERKTVLERLLNLIVNTPRNQWFPSGLNCGSLIESYKQVYGLHSH